MSLYQIDIILMNMFSHVKISKLCTLESGDSRKYSVLGMRPILMLRCVLKV